MKEKNSTKFHQATTMRSDPEFYTCLLVLFSLILISGLESQAQTEKRIYTVGNSVTDGVNFQGFKALAESRGYVHTWGRHMIPGAPLSWLWQHPNEGFMEEPFGYPTNAFPNYTWDVISLQPFDRPLEGEEGDIQMSKNYIDLAREKSPDVQIYIYSRYPRKRPEAAPETAAGWNTLWSTNYQGGWSFNEGRDFYEKLTLALRTEYAGTGLKAPLMIPLGEVMYNLNNKMEAGGVPGFFSIWQVYSDGIHMTNVGSYIVACTFYATMYQDSPVGLPVPTQYGTISNTIRDIIQQTVWETVTGMSSWTGVSVETVPVTGVSLSPATQMLAIGQTAQLTAAISPANATNKRVSWSSSNEAIATVSAAGVVTGVSAGDATITVTTQDGSFAANMTANVTADAVPVESVSVAPENVVVNTGNTVQLTATITPSYATNKNLTWSSNNPEIASVDQTGVVTGVSEGWASVFAITQDGNKEAVSQIQVTANSKPTAIISAAPTTGFAPLAVKFDAKDSSDPNPGDFILGYDWDFGDGTPHANSNAPSHTYETPGTYTVTLRVMDNHDVYSDPVTTTITVNSIDPNASVVIEYWSNVTGTNTDEIPLSTAPTSTSFLTSLEIPADVADDYGARIRGILKPTVSGDYTLYVSSDDGSKVFLSTDATPGSKALIASVTGWTSQREWNKYPTQQSAPVSLVGGQEYYFEILYKEGNGGDNLAVGWTGPGISTISVIGSPYIKQYDSDGTDTPTAPSPPTNLVASNISQTGFTLNWDASTGTVASYNVYLGGELAGNTTSTTLDITDLTAATDYSVTVKAVGNEGTLSAASNALVVRTAGSSAPSEGAKSLDLSFTDPADADRFAFIFDTGGEQVKTVENGVMKLELNKKEWHFYQIYIDPFDFINNPYVSLRIKVDQATPIKMWIKKGEDDSNRKDLYEQTLQASADYQTINIHVTDLAPLVGDMSEVGIDIGGYQVPPATFTGTVYVDYFRLGEAAKPAAPDPSTGDKSLDLSFTDPADADRFNFVIDTGGESVKTVENGVMKLEVNKLSWHFYQLMIDPFDFINNPYVSFKIKVDQATPIRMWIKKGIDTGIEKELFNQTLLASADYQTIELHYTDLVPLEGDMTELGIDIGGYQGENGARFAGTVYLDYFRLGEAAKPGVIVDTDEIAPTAPSNLLPTAITTNSFTLSWAAATDNVGVTGYKVYSNEELVATTTNINAQITGLSEETAYNIKVVAEDAAGNATPSETLTVTTLAPVPITITREVWSNLSGKGIASIPVNTEPTSTTQLTSLEGPMDAADKYGARIRAYITPEVSGAYTFYIAGDDAAELWLSFNDNPAQITKIAEVTKAVKPNEWTKVRGQKSTARNLTAGVKYYVEVLHRETTGKDHVSVGWTGPGIPAITVVGGSVLSPFGSDDSTPATTYALTITNGLGAGSFVNGAVLNINANEAPADMVFDAWTGEVAAVADVLAAATTITMPAGAVTLTATYKDKPLPSVALSIDNDTKHQTIDGFGFFGARDVWWGSSDPAHFYSEAWLDMIVSDLGVSMWRNELYPHNPPTENNKLGQDANWDKQRPMVEALKAKADQYGVDMKMILTVWSPPGEFKWQSTMAWAGDETATRGPGPEGDYYPERAIWPDTEPVRGTLNPNKYSEYAAWLSQGLQMYKNIGINVYAISPQNEPMFPQSFNSNTYTTQWYADMINAVIPQVKAQHPEVKVFGSENMLDMEGASNNYPYFYHSKLKADPTAMNNIDILAVHGYLDGVSASSGSLLAGYWTNHKREFTEPSNKKAWMTETSGYVDAWEGTSNKPGALSLAIDIQTGLYFGDLSGWVHWQGSGLGGINEYNMMSDIEVGKKYYASKNFYRFIRPGAVRIATTSPDPEVSITAYEHVANGTHTMVLINSGTSAKAINMSMTGSGLPTTYEMFVTSATKNCESSGEVSTEGSITLPAKSVVTLQAGGMPLAGSAPSAQARMTTENANIKQITKLEGVTIYPNPTSGMVSVSTAEAKEVKATITTIHGVLVNVKAKKFDAGNLSFDLSGQPAGIYILRLEAEGKYNTYKVLKE